MHLQIPQIQISSDMALGILGTSSLGRNPHNDRVVTSVYLVLNRLSTEWWTPVDYELVDEFKKALGIGPGVWVVTGTSEDGNCESHIFHLTTEDELRNPRGFLKSVARKIDQVRNKVNHLRLIQKASERGDTEEWCKLTGAKKSGLNQWP